MEEGNRPPRSDCVFEDDTASVYRSIVHAWRRGQRVARPLHLARCLPGYALAIPKTFVTMTHWWLPNQLNKHPDNPTADRCLSWELVAAGGKQDVHIVLTLMKVFFSRIKVVKYMRFKPLHGEVSRCWFAVTPCVYLLYLPGRFVLLNGI